jgi:hypothetical protein
MRAMHSLYEDACATMGPEHVNYVERDGVLPIAFSLVHPLLIEDGSLVFLGGPSPQFTPDVGATLQLAILDHGKAKTVAEMVHQRIGDFDAFRAFQGRVFQATETYLRDLDPDTLDDVIIATPYPPGIASTFSARVGGDHGIRRSDALECWIYQHGLRHMGEIEHARALVGLEGMTT